MTLPTIALSLRQPWAWTIFHGKDIENRPMRTNYRGSVLIHASKSQETEYIRTAYEFIRPLIPDAPGFGRLKIGGVIGVVDIIDCVEQSDSPWFFGPFGYILANARELHFRPCKGMLGFFKCNYDELKEAA